MKPRPKTLDEVDWEVATDALVKSSRDMTHREIMFRVEAAILQLERDGQDQEAEVYRRVLAVLERRSLN